MPPSFVFSIETPSLKCHYYSIAEAQPIKDTIDRGNMKMNEFSVEDSVLHLCGYALSKQLITEDDLFYAANTLFDMLQFTPSSDFQPMRAAQPSYAQTPLEEILRQLLDDAVSRGVISDGIATRDLFDTRLMSALTPRPSEVIRAFRSRYSESPETATDYFYKLSCDSDYIRTYRVRKDRKWVASTPYGDLDITINLSKPEKDPRAIAAALSSRQDKYPKCLLCPENEGYAGRLDHPARQTIRLIPLTLAGERWYMQYSPYVYYNEHCIVLSEKHEPMKIEPKTFTRLLDFITQFPHYTIGSNADLPIVGGSILTHQHFQGGRYTFAMARAGVKEELAFKGFADVQAGVVDWPLSVIRLDGDDPARICELAGKILSAWRAYSDESAGILAQTDGTPHNTITPIARRRGCKYELDLVLRNNRTTEQYPLGIFHPHAELHHIKKENIGLIEVMGLAVLPARLLGEMAQLRDAVLAGKNIHEIPELASHADWADEIERKHPEIVGLRESGASEASAEAMDQVLRDEIGLVFSKVLECCGVFKNTPEGMSQFRKFVEAVSE